MAGLQLGGRYRSKKLTHIAAGEKIAGAIDRRDREHTGSHLHMSFCTETEKLFHFMGGA